MVKHGWILDSYTLNVRDYLSECWDLIDNNKFFSCNENFKYLWLEFIKDNGKRTMDYILYFERV
jgi:hypothetical protein